MVLLGDVFSFGCCVILCGGSGVGIGVRERQRVSGSVWGENVRACGVVRGMDG